jgi:hypothetical protein
MPLQPGILSSKRVHFNILSNLFLSKSAYFRHINTILFNGLLHDPSLFSPPTLGKGTHHEGLNKKRDNINYLSK